MFLFLNAVTFDKTENHLLLAIYFCKVFPLVTLLMFSSLFLYPETISFIFFFKIFFLLAWTETFQLEQFKNKFASCRINKCLPFFTSILINDTRFLTSTFFLFNLFFPFSNLEMLFIKHVTALMICFLEDSPHFGNCNASRKGVEESLKLYCCFLLIFKGA